MNEWTHEPIDSQAHPVAPAAVATAEPPSVKGQASSADPKLMTLRAILRGMRDSVEAALSLLDDSNGVQAPPDDAARVVQPVVMGLARMPASAGQAMAQNDDRVVEGVYDGEHMVGGDGKSYPVPPNYASKSKLVEGDLMKLTIGQRGNFIYKQIGPVERQRLVGALAYDQAGSQFVVLAGGRSWRVLKASITYFKGESGDEAVILVPKNAPSKWAAVENVLKRSPSFNHGVS
jgi:hypothetical protein